VRKIGVVILATVVLGGVTTFATSLFPNQAHAVLQSVRAVTRSYAVEVAQNSPSLQESPSSSKSPTVLYVLLSGHEKAVSKLCSRQGPKVDGGWKATEQDIATLESNLKRIALLRSAGILKGIRIAHPENCYRQYIPIIVAGRKLIYVNAFCGIRVSDWRTQFVTICDGGESVWGVLCDPTSGEFSDLEVNGAA
jgi:hypothetical protein